MYREEQPSYPKKIRSCCLYKYPEWVRGMVGDGKAHGGMVGEGKMHMQHPIHVPQAYSSAGASGLSTTTASGRMPLSTSIRDKGASSGTYSQTNITPILLDPVSLKDTKRRASRTARIPGGSVGTNSLLKQAIANRLKPQLAADREQLYKNIFVDNTESCQGIKDPIEKSENIGRLKKPSDNLTSTMEESLSSSSFRHNDFNKMEFKTREMSLPIDEMEQKRTKIKANSSNGMNRNPVQSHRNMDLGGDQLSQEGIISPRFNNEFDAKHIRQQQMDNTTETSNRAKILQENENPRFSEDAMAKNYGNSQLANFHENHLIRKSQSTTENTIVPTTSYMSNMEQFSKNMDLLSSHCSTKVPENDGITKGQYENKKSTSPFESPSTTLSHKSVTFSDQVQLHEIEPNEFVINEEKTLEEENSTQSSTPGGVSYYYDLDEELEFEESSPERSEMMYQQEDEYPHTVMEMPERKELIYRSQQNFETSDLFRNEDNSQHPSSTYSTRPLLRNYRNGPQGPISLEHNLEMNSFSELEGRSEESSDTDVMCGLRNVRIFSSTLLPNNYDTQYRGLADKLSEVELLRERGRLRNPQNQHLHILREGEVLPEFIHNLDELESDLLARVSGNEKHVDPENVEELSKQFLTRFGTRRQVPVAEEDPVDPVQPMGSLESMLSSGSRESVISSVSIRKEAATHRNFIY